MINITESPQFSRPFYTVLSSEQQENFDIPAVSVENEIEAAALQSFLRGQARQASGPMRSALVNHISMMKCEIRDTIEEMGRDRKSIQETGAKVQQMYSGLRTSVEQFSNRSQAWTEQTAKASSEYGRIDQLLRQTRIPVPKKAERTPTHTAAGGPDLLAQALEDPFLAPKKAMIKTAMETVNILSLPGRFIQAGCTKSEAAINVCSKVDKGIDRVLELPVKGIQYVCESGETAQKACSAIKSGVQKDLGVVVEKAGEFIPSPKVVKEVLHTKYGMPSSEITYFGESCRMVGREAEVGTLLVGGSALVKGAVKTVTHPAVKETAKAASNALVKGTDRALDHTAKSFHRMTNKIFPGQNSWSVQFKDIPLTLRPLGRIKPPLLEIPTQKIAKIEFIPASFRSKKIGFKYNHHDVKLELDFVQTTDKTLRVYVNRLYVVIDGEFQIGSTQTTGVFFESLKKIQELARQTNSERLHLQFLPLNT